MANIKLFLYLTLKPKWINFMKVEDSWQNPDYFTTLYLLLAFPHYNRDVLWEKQQIVILHQWTCWEVKSIMILSGIEQTKENPFPPTLDVLYVDLPCMNQ